MAYAATTATIIDHVIGRIRGNTADATLRAQTLAWLNESQYEDVPDDAFFLETDGTITFTGAASYALAASFGRLAGNGVRLTDPERVLTPKSIRWMDENDPTWAVTGTPAYYSIWDEKMYFQPVPASNTGYYRYYKIATELADSATTPDIPLQWRHVIILGALARARQWIDSPAISDRIEYQLKEAVEKIRVRNTRMTGFPGDRGRNESVEGALFD